MATANIKERLKFIMVIKRPLKVSARAIYLQQISYPLPQQQ